MRWSMRLTAGARPYCMPLSADAVYGMEINAVGAVCGSPLLCCCAALLVTVFANAPSLQLRSFPPWPAPRGTGRHALSSASTPGSPTGARESSTSVPLADSVVPCPPVRPKAPSRATPQLTSRQIGDAPSRIIGFKASKTRCIRTRAQWDPAVPRGLTSVRGEAPAFKQLVCRCVGRGGNERAGTTGGALAI